VVVDSGTPDGTREPTVRKALEQLSDLVFEDEETKVVASGPEDPYVDPSGRYGRIVVAGRHEFGEQEAQRFVERLRARIIPAAGFPEATRVAVGGAPAQGVDFLDRAYGAFPWLVGGLLALTYVVLLRAFRSLLLPLKAVLLNLLSVAAAYGLLVVIFRWDVGAETFGLRHADEIEGWIPIFLFAAIFGISMDYEVFLVSRMREAWDEAHDNARAVAHGLQRTGRVVTAAAAIMVGAFAGFAAGDVAGLQQFGVGLMLAVIIDATIVRAILLPSLMTVLGPYNWWLPASVARLARVTPSPLVR
jgi:RND superfamily putative drug exporter